MWFDILLQAVMLLSGIFMFLYMHNIPSKALTHLRHYLSRHKSQAKRHFVHGAQLLSRARSTNDPSLAQSAAASADAALLLDPSDAASHILKALALQFLGFNPSALASLDAALSPLAVKSLSEEEKADALLRRAELRVVVGEKVGDEAVVEDLVEAVRLRPDSVRAWCLLGDCYEAKGMAEKAKAAFETAKEAQPDCKAALSALERLAS